VFWKPQPNPKNYVELLKAAYKAIKEVDPDSIVVGMCTSEVDLKFIEGVLKLGGGKFMDVVSVHPYQGRLMPDAEECEFTKIKKLGLLLEKYGTPRPIWITEVGCQSYNREMEKIQANYIVRLFSTMLSDEYNALVERVLYFTIHDWGPRWKSWGPHWGLVYPDNSPKPAFVAYHTTAYYLRNAEFAGSLNLGPDVRFHVFWKDGQLIGVGWSQKGSQKVQIPFKRARIVDIMGNTIEELRERGGVSVYLDEEPKFFLFN